MDVEMIDQNDSKNSKTGHHITFKTKIFDPSEWSLDWFEIGCPLSWGKYGHVFLAREKETKMVFAIKMIFKSQMKQSTAYMSNLWWEFEIHARLNHPNIIQIYGYFWDKKKIYFILEWASWGDLFTILWNTKTGFAEKTVAKYMK